MIHVRDSKYFKTHTNTLRFFRWWYCTNRYLSTLKKPLILLKNGHPIQPPLAYADRFLPDASLVCAKWNLNPFPTSHYVYPTIERILWIRVKFQPKSPFLWSRTCGPIYHHYTHTHTPMPSFEYQRLLVCIICLLKWASGWGWDTGCIDVWFINGTWVENIFNPCEIFLRSESKHVIGTVFFFVFIIIQAGA